MKTPEQAAMHEDFSRAEQVKGSSNRAFGWTFAAVFLVIALWPLAFGGGLRWWSLTVAICVMLTTLVRPFWLTTPNRLWLRFGALLHRLASPVVLALMFYAVVTPIGVLRRAFGTDILSRRRGDPEGTYWVKRNPPGPKPSSMSKQF
jgi:hypothetical protein